jgi:hypothetical protein
MDILNLMRIRHIRYKFEKKSRKKYENLDGLDRIIKEEMEKEGENEKRNAKECKSS